MKEKIKTFLKVSTGIIVGILGVGEIIYEGALNTKISAKVGEKIPLDDERAMEIYLHHPVFSNARKWMRDMNPVDMVVTDENGEDIHGYIIESPEKSNKWAVCVHGYRAVPQDMAPYAKKYYEMGFNVLLPSMRGYGKDTHKYCTMGYRDKDIVKIWTEWIVGINSESSIILHGVSMGSSTVIMTTGEILSDNIKCAIADCGFTSCYDAYAAVMHNMHIPTFPILNAVSAISKFRGNLDFNKDSAVKAVERSNTPTLFIHGTGDTTVPFEMMEVLFNACVSEKEKLAVPGALHAASVAADNKLYWNTVNAFEEKYI